VVAHLDLNLTSSPTAEDREHIALVIEFPILVLVDVLCQLPNIEIRPIKRFDLLFG
jgi:hypothetical protein